MRTSVLTAFVLSALTPAAAALAQAVLIGTPVGGLEGQGCGAGVPTLGHPCDDENECTNDACRVSDPQAEDATYYCVNIPRDGASCTDDGDPCTDDVCQGATCRHPSQGLRYRHVLLDRRLWKQRLRVHVAMR